MTNTADVERAIMQGYLTECETQNGRLRRQNVALREAIREHIDLDNDGVLRHESTCQTRDEAYDRYPCDCGHERLGAALTQAEQSHARSPVDDSESAS